jgi:hypothetical protein
VSRRNPPDEGELMELTDAEKWAYTDQRLTLGFIDADGKRVRGFLETLNEHTEQLAMMRRVDSWLMRVLAVVVLLHFLGVDNALQLVKTIEGK